VTFQATGQSKGDLPQITGCIDQSGRVLVLSASHYAHLSLCDYVCFRYVSIIELSLFVRCMGCGRQSCEAHGTGGMVKSGLPFLILFISQMMKSPETQRSIVDHDNGWVYLGLLCFAIPVHELASAVEAVSAAQLGATTDLNPLDMANEIIDRGMQQLIDTPGYVGSVNEMMAEDAGGGFDNYALSATLHICSRSLT